MTETWQPGIPLHANPNRHHQSGFLSFRYDSDKEYGTEGCGCIDRSSWPETPRSEKGWMDDKDELAEFIAEYHTWRRAGCVEGVSA